MYECVYTKICKEKTRGFEASKGCIVKRATGQGLVSAGLEDGSKSTIFEDDVIKLYGIGGRHVGLYKKGRIRD
jgi:hypothetical protein